MKESWNTSQNKECHLNRDLISWISIINSFKKQFHVWRWSNHVSILRSFLSLIPSVTHNFERSYIGTWQARLFWIQFHMGISLILTDYAVISRLHLHSHTRHWRSLWLGDWLRSFGDESQACIEVASIVSLICCKSIWTERINCINRPL